MCPFGRTFLVEVAVRWYLLRVGLQERLWGLCMFFDRLLVRRFAAHTCFHVSHRDSPSAAGTRLFLGIVRIAALESPHVSIAVFSLQQWMKSEPPSVSTCCTSHILVFWYT